MGKFLQFLTELSAHNKSIFFVSETVVFLENITLSIHTWQGILKVV